jgi:hypothetical protein
MQYKTYKLFKTFKTIVLAQADIRRKSRWLVDEAARGVNGGRDVRGRTESPSQRLGLRLVECPVTQAMGSYANGDFDDLAAARFIRTVT